MKLHGPECFSIEIIEEVSSLDLLNEREKYWIQALDTIKGGYNILPGGDGLPKFSEIKDSEWKASMLAKMSAGGSIGNLNRWSKASVSDRAAAGRWMKAGYNGKNRSKIVKDTWAILSEEERKEKTDGIRSYWKSLSKEEKAKRCTTHHRGRPKTYNLITPENECIEIVCLRDFCKKHDLSEYYLKKTKRKNESYCGWKMVE